MRDLNLTLATALLAVAAVTSGCIKIEKGGNDCPDGSRGCPCTSQGKCESEELSCVDSVCVKQGASSTKNGGGGTSSSDDGQSRDSGAQSAASGSASNGGSSGASGKPSSSDGSGGAARGSEPYCKMKSGSFVAKNSAAATCGAAASISLTVGESGYLETVEGKSCTLTEASSDHDCFGIGDKYECGGCVFTTGEDLDGFEIGVDDCDAGCAASHCCPLPGGGSLVALGYNFAASHEGTGGSNSSAGSSDACSRCSDACSGIPGCSCCAECGGMCFN
jgi:hypothetical protein